MEFIDTHTHNSDEAYSGCEDEIIRRAVNAGVTHLLQADIDSSERDAMYSLVGRHPGVLHPMLGLYPGSVRKDWKNEMDLMEGYLDRKPVAIGEIGLDYHEGTEFRDEQKEAFIVQLEMASRLDLPVNIHLREATDDFFSVMERCRHLSLRGNLHAFSGSYETFCRLQKYGDWYVGIGGVVTFKKASIAEDLKRIPLERVLLETDSPYLAPTPFRGTRNESANIPVIAAAVAAIKGTGIETVAEITTRNAKTLFSI